MQNMCLAVIQKIATIGYINKLINVLIGIKKPSKLDFSLSLLKPLYLYN